jgi:AbrB family looped-hinge helix DNA binding protein
MTTTLTRKGQVTIPQQIRGALNLAPGCSVDIRGMYIEVQQMAFEKGLIPYIPTERDMNNG